jgi:MGT family glycosyltransferase
MAQGRQPRKFLITTLEGGGSVGPAITVARKLVEAGHDVRVMSDACNRPEAESSGARFVPWTRAPSRTDRSKDSDLHRDWEAADLMDGFGRVIAAIVVGPALRYAQDTMEELAREPADLVISAELLLGVVAGCEKAGQPVVLLPSNSMVITIKAALDHAAASDAPPANEQEARMAAIAQAMGAALMQAVPPFNMTREALGLPPIGQLLDQMAYVRMILAAVSPSFDMAPPGDTPGLTYIGPQLDDPAWAEQWQSPWPAGDKRPLVLVGFSTTFQDHAGVLQNVIDALGTLPVRALVTLGPAIASEELQARDNVALAVSAPHNQVMKQASLVVTHGGYGTLTRALAHRLPLLVMPQGRDQYGNAERLAAHGAGIALPPGADAATIAGAVRQLLDEAGFAEAAERLGAQVDREMRESRVVELLEELSA